MTLTSLDVIVNRWLLENGYPVHFYTEGLLHAATCLREQTFDTLQIINTKEVTLNDYFAADLPPDFSDVVMVGVPAGGRFQPVPQMRLNPLRNMDANHQYVPYTTDEEDQDSANFGLVPGAMWFWNMNEYGETVGRYFGAGGGAKANGYEIFRERNQIQFTETFTSPTALLMYVSDGQSVDNASQIDTRAFATINSFIAWKRSPNRNNDFSPEAMLFKKQRKLLRSRMNNMTTVDLINILRRNYIAASKS